MMAVVHTTLEYLQDLALYRTEKPYWYFRAPRPDFDPDQERSDNLEFKHFPVGVRNLRECSTLPTLENTGFEVVQHESRHTRFDTLRNVADYRKETEECLQAHLNAEFVRCYDSCLRKNVVFERSQFDMSDPLLKQGPAQGVHIGIYRP